MSPGLEKNDIARFLLCSSILEERVYKAYDSLAERVTNTQISTLLHSIAVDSKKHSLLLKVLSESIEKVNQTEIDCSELMGDAWNKLEKLARTEVYSVPEKSDLFGLIKDMSAFESYLGEEYFSATQLILIELSLKESSLEHNQIKTIIDWIIEDEERHVKIIQAISTIVSKGYV
ncbi:MAG: ferritin family protein [Nitrososphaeria archaeon]